MDHHPTLKITLQYANDLHKVNLISKMDVYAIVSISGGDRRSMQKVKTPADHEGGSNPTWGFPMKFIVEEAALQQNLLVLDFKLVCERALGDKHVGDVHVPVKELVDSSRAKGGKVEFVSYQVTKPSGKPKGHLTFSYQFIGRSTTSTTGPPPPSPVGKGPIFSYQSIGKCTTSTTGPPPPSPVKKVELGSSWIYHPAGYYPATCVGPALREYIMPRYCYPPASASYSYSPMVEAASVTIKEN